MTSFALTNYQKVRCFNIVFDSPRSDTPNHDVFKNNPTLVKLRWDLIHEESTELFDALDKKDYVEIIDAVSDILYVVLGAFDAFGYNFDGHPKFSKKIAKCTDIEELILSYGVDLIPELDDYFSQTRMEVVFNNQTCNNLLNIIRSNYQDQLNILNSLINFEKYHDVINQLVVIHNYLYLWAYLFGFNLDQSFALVHESNMSKLATTEEIANETVQWYLDHPEMGYDSPAHRPSEVKENGQTRWIIYNNSTKKALKSIKYNPVDFKTFLKNGSNSSGSKDQ
jgi:predicted HAD superfamily Cof-like phosphohydrolase